MAYDDGYYYGQCKIVAVVDDAADNGKTVLITTDNNKTYSGTIANKRCEFLLPPRTLYTVQKVSGESVEFTTEVEAGYGDCILVHLNTGYVVVKQGDIVGLDYIKAATDDSLKNKVPEAKVIKALNSSLTANDKTFQFAYDSSKGAYGYLIDGTFKSFNDATALYEVLQYSGLVTADMTYEQMLQALANYFPAWDGYLFKSGDASSNMFVGWNNVTIDTNKARLYRKDGNYCSIITTEKIDITNYSTLTIDYAMANPSGIGVNNGVGSITFGICSNNNPSSHSDFVISNANNYSGTPGRQTLSLNISNYTGSYYIKVYHGGRTYDGAWSDSKYADVYNVYLSK